MLISKAGKIIRDAGGKVIDTTLSRKNAERLSEAAENVFEGAAAVGVGAAKKGGAIVDRMFEFKINDKDSMGFTFKTTGTGKAVIGGLIGAGTIAGIASAEEKSWSGIRDNRIYRPSPSPRDYFEEDQMPSYMNNASADGSLIFALYRNRLG